MAVDPSEMLFGNSYAEATQRCTMPASRHRVTLLVPRSTPLCGLSMTLVVAKHLCKDSGTCKRCKVNISCIPSRRLRAADSYSRSKKRANCSSRFSPSSAVFTFQAARTDIGRLAVLFFRQFREDVTNFVIAAALHRLFAA